MSAHQAEGVHFDEVRLANICYTQSVQLNAFRVEERGKKEREVETEREEEGQRERERGRETDR